MAHAQAPACVHRVAGSSVVVRAPVNFNAAYEVDIFAVIPLLAACLAILSRASSLDTWLGHCDSVRSNGARSQRIQHCNDCPFGDLRLLGDPERKTRKKEGLPPWNVRHLGLAYGVPLLLAALACGFFYWRSIVKFPALIPLAKPKHTVNMAQVYAFGYQQRHPKWTKSPWREWAELMQRDFAEPLPTLAEMIQRNPRAVLGNMCWNLKLAPGEIQLLLFTSMSGHITRDYIPVRFNAPEALPLNVLTGAIWFAGLTLIYPDRARWWNAWLKQRTPGWLAILSMVSMAPFIILTERPRPCYLFSVGIFLMSLTGMCVFAICQRWPKLQRLSTLMPDVMICAPVFIPSYYQTFDRDKHFGLLNFYRRLAP